MKNSILIRAISTIFFLISCYYSIGQPVVGFWEVKEVKVAGKIVTPVAKWIRVNINGIFQSGNGWLQNSEGTWTFDKAANTYLPVEKNGLLDKYGAFKVSFDGDQMYWERIEDNNQVIVKLENIEALPKSTGDHLVGIWDLKDRLTDNKSDKTIFDHQDNYSLFLRWDRIYVERTQDGSKVFGYWHINGHRPELTLIQMEGDRKESWRVEVDEKTLIMHGISSTNKSIKLLFVRIDHIPD